VLGFVLLVCALWGVAFGRGASQHGGSRKLARGGSRDEASKAGEDKAALDLLAQMLQFAAGGGSAPTGARELIDGAK
jgi:hypothetical protein